MTVRTQLDLLGTMIDCVDASQALSQIDSFVRSGRFHQVVTVNVDFLRLASKDKGFQKLVNNADLVLADGMPLVWASRLRSRPLPGRVTGVDMMLACAQLAATRGYRIFLLGAAPGVARATGEILQQRFPGLCIAGTYSPPSTDPADQEECVRVVNAAQADMLFVAFGAPKQDQWICQYQDRLNVPVCMGVGGSFDMLTGKVRRAPLWLQERGLEWLYRLVQEPRRLWKRYIIHDLPVFARLMFQPRESVVTSQHAEEARSFESVSAKPVYADPIFVGEASTQMSEMTVRVGQSA
jgi:N-acetylglucosaminyldiphosphoundecaprenol N-acetyl-beta-D-mannosaminyltransferase